MIIEAIFTALCSVASGFLDILPSVDTGFLDSWAYVCGVLKDIFTGIGCLLPLGSIFPLIGCTIGLQAFRLVFAIVIRIKSFLPFWGGA